MGAETSVKGGTDPVDLLVWVVAIVAGAMIASSFLPPIPAPSIVALVVAGAVTVGFVLGIMFAIKQPEKAVKVHDWIQEKKDGV